MAEVRSVWAFVPLSLLPGVAHSVALVSVGHPFDTVKTRLQLQMHPSMWRCVTEMWRNEGVMSFYRGAAMPLATLVIKRPFEFAVFEWFNAASAGTKYGPFLGGGLAGLTSATLGCPFSVVKIQMQMTGKDVHRSFVQAVISVWNARGFRGFYLGLPASIYKDVPFATGYLGIYGNLREALPQNRWSTAMSGGLASIVTWTLFQPLDTLRTIIQACALREGQDTRWMPQLRKAVQGGGFLRLWAGWSPIALRSIPTSGVAMVAYEWARAATGAASR